MKMSDRQLSDRPREKLQAKGAASLSDFELLQALIGNGTAQADVSKISRSLLKVFQEEEPIDLAATVAEIRQIDIDSRELDEKIRKFTIELGIDSPFGEVS